METQLKAPIYSSQVSLYRNCHLSPTRVAGKSGDPFSVLQWCKTLTSQYLLTIYYYILMTIKHIFILQTVLLSSMVFY